MEGGGMARRSKQEYLGLMWQRYQHAGRAASPAARAASPTDSMEAIRVLAWIWSNRLSLCRETEGGSGDLAPVGSAAAVRESGNRTCAPHHQCPAD